jgi:tetratricopeptide (TPR) repeat protein
MSLFSKLLPAIAGGWLMAGCASTPPPVAAPAAKAPDVRQRARAHAHYSAALIHDMANEPEAALDDYYQAALLDPGDEDLAMQVADELWEHRQPEKAAEILARATAYPGAGGALFARLGFIDAQIGRLDAAIAANRHAIQKAPGLVAGWQDLALGLLRKRQPQAALSILRQASAQTNANASFELVIAGVLAGFAREYPAYKAEADPLALKLLRRADQLNPEDLESRLKLADGLDLLGQGARAAEIYSQLLSRTDGRPELRQNLLVRLTDLYIRLGDYKRAMEQLQAILHDDPANATANFQLGALAYESGQPAVAAEYFHKTLLLRPEFEQAYYDLAQAQLVLDQPGEALATLATARKSYPHRFSGELLSALACGRLKRFDEAIAHFTTAEVLAKAGDPGRLNGQFYYELGATYEAKGDLPAAQKYLRKALSLAPDFAEALNFLGYMWADQGAHLAEARRLIERALKTSPDNPAYLDSQAWVLFKLKEPGKALPPMLRALELNGRPDAVMLDHLGDIYRALGRIPEARDAWQRALAAAPDDAIRKKLDSTPAR